MKLKLDENGHVVVSDGKPVYVHEDGKEIPFDAPAAMQKIQRPECRSQAAPRSQRGGGSEAEGV